MNNNVLSSILLNCVCYRLTSVENTREIKLLYSTEQT